VVPCSELPNNGGMSVTYAAEQLAAEVIRSHRSTPLVWIEHWPEESTDGGVEMFDWWYSLATGWRRGRPTWGGEGMDRQCNLEEAGPRHRGGVGGRESVGQAIQLTP